MKITKGLILKLFSGANMQRWNDKMRLVELTELDKQAHKMMIAYVLGKYEKKKSGVDWIDIIEGGIFEYLQRVEITDIKSPIFHQIREVRTAQEVGLWATESSHYTIRQRFQKQVPGLLFRQ